jgi:hypothetical protein
MPTICFKCKRSVEPLERREKDSKAKKVWLISYCPFERCAANLEITEALKIKVWNGSFFENETI